MDGDGMMAGIMFLGGIGLGSISSSTITDCSNRSYPKTDDVQSGYVVPSRLEIDLVDLDGDGKLETTLKYHGTRYLLLQNDQVEVSLKKYEIK